MDAKVPRTLLLGQQSAPSSVAVLLQTTLTESAALTVKILAHSLFDVAQPPTLQALQTVDAGRFAGRFAGQRLKFMTELPTWPTFGRGWARRIADNLLR